MFHGLEATNPAMELNADMMMPAPAMNYAEM